jgi:hypothetical protein
VRIQLTGNSAVLCQVLLFSEQVVSFYDACLWFSIVGIMNVIWGLGTYAVLCPKVEDCD